MQESVRNNLLEEVFLRIEEHQQDIVNNIVDLVKKPSVSARGEGIEECTALVESKLAQLGAKTEVLRLPNANPIIFGRIGSRLKLNKTILFYNHYDVQPPEPLELWQTPPFEPSIRDGRIYGRGAHDDKGEIATRLAVIKAFLEALGGDVPCNLAFLIEGEEEVGSRNLSAYSQKFSEKFRADSIIWEFGGVDEKERPMITLGVKGILYVELSCQTANRDLHSSYAAIVENPMWKLVWALSEIKGKDDRIKVPGWYDDVRQLTRDEEEVLERQPFPEDEFKKSVGIKKFINNANGVDIVKDLAGKPTANIAGVISGYTSEGSKTVLPSIATAKMDFRLVPEQDPSELIDLLRAHLLRLGLDDIEVKVLQEERAARTRVTAPIVDHASWGARKVFETEPIVVVSSPATGPMHIFAEVNDDDFQCVAIGASHPDSRPHSPNENQRIDLLVKGAKWIAATVYSFATS